VARFKAININQLPLLVGEKKEDKWAVPCGRHLS
jgi:hypothetical protein